MNDEAVRAITLAERLIYDTTLDLSRRLDLDLVISRLGVFMTPRRRLAKGLWSDHYTLMTGLESAI